jgi:hypothetical protein
VVAIATAGLLGFAGVGCTSSDDPPEPAPLPTESPSPSGEDQTPPELPSEAQGKSAKAAKAFAAHWIRTLNYAAENGDASSIRALSSSSCAACTAIADLIDKVHKDGGSIRGKGWETRRLELVSSADAGHVVDAFVQVHPQIIIEKAGGSSTRFEGGRRLKTFWISSGPNGLQVDRLDQPA